MERQNRLSLTRTPSLGKLADLALYDRSDGLFLLALIHIPAFRRRVGKFAYQLLVGYPSAIYDSAIVQALFDNLCTRLFAGYLLTPLIVGFLSVVAMRILHFDWDAASSCWRRRRSAYRRRFFALPGARGWKNAWTRQWLAYGASSRLTS